MPTASNKRGERMTTAYDASVEVGREIYRKEKAEREHLELLEQERKGHKVAARLWFDTLAELWPPDTTEQYWTRATERLKQVWDEHKDNKLLQELMLMTHEYLGDIAYGKHD